MERKMFKVTQYEKKVKYIPALDMQEAKVLAHNAIMWRNSNEDFNLPSARIHSIQELPDDFFDDK